MYRCFVSGLLGGVSTTRRECRIAKKDKTIGFRESDKVKNETRIEIYYRVRMLNSASFSPGAGQEGSIGRGREREGFTRRRGEGEKNRERDGDRQKG